MNADGSGQTNLTSGLGGDQWRARRGRPTAPRSSSRTARPRSRRSAAVDDESRRDRSSFACDCDAYPFPPPGRRLAPDGGMRIALASTVRRARGGATHLHRRSELGRNRFLRQCSAATSTTILPSGHLSSGFASPADVLQWDVLFGWIPGRRLQSAAAFHPATYFQILRPMRRKIAAVWI